MVRQRRSSAHPGLRVHTSCIVCGTYNISDTTRGRAHPAQHHTQSLSPPPRAPSLSHALLPPAIWSSATPQGPGNTSPDCRGHQPSVDGSASPWGWEALRRSVAVRDAARRRASGEIYRATFYSLHLSCCVPMASRDGNATGERNLSWIQELLSII